MSFPEVAAKGFALEAALKAVASTSKLLGFSVVGVAGSMAVLLPIIQSAVEAWKAYSAITKEATSDFDAYAASVGANVSAVDALARLTGISHERRAELNAMLDSGSPERERMARMQIIGLQSQQEKEAKAMAQWQGMMGGAESYVGGTLTGVEGQTFSATKAWNEAREAVLNYKKEGVDTELALKQIDEAYAGVIERIHQEKIDKLQEEDMREVESRSRRIQEEQAAAQQIKSFQDDLLEATLSGDERERFANLRTFRERIAHIQQLSLAEKITGQEEIDMIKAAAAAFERQNEKIKLLKKDTHEWLQIAAQGTQQFASGFASALTAGGKGMQQFFADFFKHMADAILQTLLLKAIFSTITSFGGSTQTAASITGVTSGLAEGGVRFAASGLMMTSGPTFLPKFNVIAGEANPEMLTVLRAPQMMQIGGIKAAVGYAGDHQLAISRAADLQRAGARPGPVEINITLDPGLRAEIVNDASHAAVIRVNTNLKQDSDTSRAVKALTT